MRYKKTTNQDPLMLFYSAAVIETGKIKERNFLYLNLTVFITVAP